MKILVAGHNVRHIACSASRAGHQVFALGCYCDLDLIKSVHEAIKLDADVMSSKKGIEYIKKSIEIYLEDRLPEAMILGPGVEELDFETLKFNGLKILNNSSPKISQVSDKFWLANWLKKRGYPTIRTQIAKDSHDLNGYPVMVKPRKGAGGAENRLIWDEIDLARLKDDFIVQEWITGRPSSVSVIANGKEAIAIAVNEQLMGISWLGTKGFQYCGNITPLEASVEDLTKMAKMAENIATDLKLMGSNGVDFLLTSNGPVVVEVNPRFQGSLDAVEMATKMNIFQAHILSFEGVLPQKPKSFRPAGRAVLFAKDDLKITKDLSEIRWISDIPKKDVCIKKGDPISSILATGNNRKDVVDLLKSRSATMSQECHMEI